jgi:ABC-type uncharacterized transport system permease subunit
MKNDDEMMKNVHNPHSKITIQELVLQNVFLHMFPIALALILPILYLTRRRKGLVDNHYDLYSHSLGLDIFFLTFDLLNIE